MSRDQRRRIQLSPTYILHQKPYRDTSRILEVFTREHGRLTLFARGVRGPKSKLAAVLQPFQLLLASWSGRGEAAQLTACECAPEATPLPAPHLMACFYLNELLLKLTLRHDPHVGLFDAYGRTLTALRQGAALEPALRIFEKRLLEEVGFGVDLSSDAATGEPIEPEAHYQFHPAQGLKRSACTGRGLISGRSLLALARDSLSSASELEDARALLTAAIAHCLEGRELATRAVARALVQRARPSSSSPRERP